MRFSVNLKVSFQITFGHVGQDTPLLNPSRFLYTNVDGNIFRTTMSMSLNIRTVADKDIDDIIDEPLKLQLLHYGELLDPQQVEDEEALKTELENWKPSGDVTIFHLEAAFQSLHYILTGETDNKGQFPLNFLMCNRIAIGEIGWGKANFYNSKDVRAIRDSLAGIEFDEFKKRFDADFFNQSKIYPRGYVWRDDDINGLWKTFNKLREFINATVDKGLGFYLTIV